MSVDLPPPPIIDTPEAVELLQDGRAYQFLLVFVGRDTTVKEAAAYKGVTTSIMAYWVKKFVSVGLLRETQGVLSG